MYVWSHVCGKVSPNSTHVNTMWEEALAHHSKSMLKDQDF